MPSSLPSALRGTLAASRGERAAAGPAAPSRPADAPRNAPRAPQAAADESAGLTPDIFYRILLGDVALQRG